MTDQEISPATVQNEQPPNGLEKPQILRKRRRVLNSRPAAVYRYFDEKQRLLYVGISASALTRMAAHKSTARWFRRARFVTVEWYHNRWDALEAEARAICTEYPRYNIGHILFTSKENRLRRELAKEGRWVQPPKQPKEPLRTFSENATLAVKLAQERKEEMRLRNLARL